MRRVLESSRTQQDHWRAEVLRRPLHDAKDTHLQAGLRAYAAEQIDREQTIIKLWGEKWKVVRLLADPIIAGDIPDDIRDTVYAGLTHELEVEVADDQEEDDFEMDSLEAL